MEHGRSDWVRAAAWTAGLLAIVWCWHQTGSPIFVACGVGAVVYSMGFGSLAAHKVNKDHGGKHDR